MFQIYWIHQSKQIREFSATILNIFIPSIMIRKDYINEVNKFIITKEDFELYKLNWCLEKQIMKEVLTIKFCDFVTFYIFLPK